jgi:hypothetical protein
MSQRLIVLDEAEEELLEAEKWYEKRGYGASSQSTACRLSNRRHFCVNWSPANFC